MAREMTPQERAADELNDKLAQAFVCPSTTLGECRDIISAALQATRRAALLEAVQVLCERRDKLVKDWENDESVPKGEHDEKDCDGACDLYCVQIIELGLTADVLTRLAQEG